MLNPTQPPYVQNPYAFCVTANYVSVQTQRLQDLCTELRPATTTQVLSKLVHKVWESKCGYLYASRATFNYYRSEWSQRARHPVQSHFTWMHRDTIVSTLLPDRYWQVSTPSAI